jgi:hypothetical protein
LIPNTVKKKKKKSINPYKALKKKMKKPLKKIIPGSQVIEVVAPGSRAQESQ